MCAVLHAPFTSVHCTHTISKITPSFVHTGFSNSVNDNAQCVIGNRLYLARANFVPMSAKSVRVHAYLDTFIAYRLCDHRIRISIRLWLSRACPSDAASCPLSLDLLFSVHLHFFASIFVFENTAFCALRSPTENNAPAEMLSFSKRECIGVCFVYDKHVDVNSDGSTFARR